MKKPIYIFYIFLTLLGGQLTAQKTITKSIKSFGAVGNGRTNDTKAFAKAAAFFNARGGNGKLLIPAGKYLVGVQTNNKGAKGKMAYSTEDVLRFNNVSNMVIEGAKGSSIKYTNGLKLGSFEPLTGKAFYKNNPVIPDKQYAANLGTCVYFFNCYNVTIRNITLHGNSGTIEFGGGYGDKGIQLYHYGIYIENSRKISVDKVTASYFGLDGIMVNNDPNGKKDSITVSNSTFEYNTRQGMSWVDGNDLLVNNCQFNHTGQGKYVSSPGAGLDIEGEGVSVSGGRFYNCCFINNKGCGMVADAGPVSNCYFEGCTFWGTKTYSAWVTKPGFEFRDCNFYGSVVHGFAASNEQEATKYFKCHFEDKPYNDSAAYGNFLIDANGPKRLRFDSCTMVANKCKLLWLRSGGDASDDNSNISNSYFIVKSAAFPKGDYVAVMSKVNFKNNTVEFTDPKAKDNRYWPNGNTSFVDLGGNKVVYK